ncbi:MAG: hypothetical protein JOZ46_07635 [Candidatus Dormibacteraeota bacterium]|nr:hypothetical protein [Candidatus Dormibacteraeota bacterium]MBV9525670.1 hypothetical protein [Candidatus Dormibacteraeota bacterium]
MILAAVASALSAVFAAVVAARFVSSRRPAFAVWAIGLLIFAAAAGFQAAGEARGFDEVTFRGFYLLGAVLGVIYLALGTIFLLAPRRVAWACAVVLGLVTIALAIDAAVIPVDQSQLDRASGVLGDAIQKGTLLFIGVVFLNIVGTVVLVGGSLWSAYRFARSRAGVDRVVCNVLLTVGALVIAAGFSVAKTKGLGISSLETLGALEAVGIAIMFAGFLSLGRVGVRAPRHLAQAGPQPELPA